MTAGFLTGCSSFLKASDKASGIIPMVAQGEYAKLRLPMNPADLTFEDSISITMMTQIGTHWLNTLDSCVKLLM